MGFIQTNAKNFSEKVPNKLIGIEVWETAGFEGEMLHLIGEEGIAIPRAYRQVFETEAEATREWEHPYIQRDWHAIEKALRRR